MVSQANIEPARTKEDMEAIQILFRSYADSLNIDLTFQDFQAELSSLPGRYAPPHGELLLARGFDGMAVGCVALRPLGQDGCCEMKRLYVTPAGRGLGLGKRLATEIIGIAVKLKYHEMKLDTLLSMTDALALYAKLGFVPTDPYYNTPLLSATQFLSCRLTAEPSNSDVLS
ncbi:MAG: hypothetical protein LQ352_005335 [Teloschistes flavicans]|nr:MAG: hypothetical protein LQ352_005335 [Teloschistes flavicans]